MALRGGFKQDELVATDPEPPIGDAFELRLRERQGRCRASITTKSLPRPCILRKGKAAGDGTGDTVIERDSEGIDQKWKPRSVEPVGATSFGPTIHWRYNGFSDKGKTLGLPSLRTGPPDRMQRLLAPLAFASALRPEGGVAAAAILGFSLLFTVPLGAQGEVSGEGRQKPVVTPIQVPNLSLGVVIFPNGKAINLSVGTGSSAHRSVNDIPGRIWLLTDRGPNIECGEARRIIGLEPEQACAGNRSGRILPLPGFVPSIYAADVGPDNVARINVYIPLKGKSGKPLSGRPPLGNGRYESTFAIDGKPLPPDPSGVDPEGLVRVSDGTFWIAEELGPSLLQVAADGTVLKRIVPQGLQNDFKDADYEVVPSLPPILRYRAQNRGFEALALSPDEKFLYVMLQGPLANRILRRPGARGICGS